MTFFDKFFTIKNRSHKTESELHLPLEPLSLSSSVFDIEKEQIRVVLYRECGKRGRKLLFDSNSVEKLPLVSHANTRDFLVKSKLDEIKHAKFFDFVEVTQSHGYKYKKPCNDVPLLEEMIFGSAAMVLKGGSTCKIHSLTTPKCIIFTSIVHAPGQCHYPLPSERYMETRSGPSSETSLNECSNGSRTSCSDSKLYSHKQSANCSTPTYPCLTHKHVREKLLCSNEASVSNFYDKPFFRKCWATDYIDKMCCADLKKCERTSCMDRCRTSSDKLNSEQQNFSECVKTDEIGIQSNVENNCRCDSVGALSTFQLYECSKDFSSTNSLHSSLSSLRRRWMQSRESSVDEVCCEESDITKNRTRTKLGMGLVVNLTNNLEEELEKFLFNHTIIIEGILNKLQTSIESAYMKKENFVDLTYTAFTHCQQSMYELITGGKYSRPMWLALTEEPTEESDSQLEENACGTFQKNLNSYKAQDTLTNIQRKFLNNFCDVILKFDTKDTNFFISTLLTAVLTHHLSWVTGVAELDILLPQHKMKSVIKGLRPYNPIWAQLNDLNGILGSPLKSAKTVVTGSAARKSSIASIIQVLTYFIRCYNVAESVYDFDIDEITNLDQRDGKSSEEKVDNLKNFDCEIACTYAFISKATEKTVLTESDNCGQNTEINVAAEEKIHIAHHADRDLFQRNSTDGLRRSKSCLSRLHDEESSVSYSRMDDLTHLEKIHISSNNYLLVDDYGKKIQKLIRVPSKAIDCHLEQNLSPDEGYDTVDSCTVGETYSKNAETGSGVKGTDDVLFVLGESDELVNLSKMVLTDSLLRDVAKEDSETVLSDCNSENSSQTMPPPTDPTICDCRTLNHEQIAQRTVEENSEIAERHFFGGEVVCESNDPLSFFQQLPMPRALRPNHLKTKLGVSSVLGSVNEHYNSEQIIQGVLDDKSLWLKTLRRDLSLCVHNPVLDRNVTEALCIIGDMNSWEVSLCSSHSFLLDKNSFNGVRIGMSQLVADMLESLLHICRVKLSPDFCLSHIEKKLHEIYSKSKSVAELLNSTDMCSIEYLTSRLDISVNDVPLLLSVASTHSPHISTKYGLSYS